MSKILKNTTLSDIELGASGLFIPASGQITISEQDYLLVGSSDSIAELTTLINAGDIIVNDGSNDLPKQRGINFLKYADNFLAKNSIYVGLSGSDTEGDGSQNRPFASLTGAYNAIVAGDFENLSNTQLAIILEAGEYTQDPVDFSGLNAQINIIGKGFKTQVNASNPNLDLITLGENGSLLNIALGGVTASDKYQVVWRTTNGGLGAATNLRIEGGSNGLAAFNDAGTLRVTIQDSIMGLNTGNMVVGNDNTVITITGIVILGDGITTVGVQQNGSGEILIFGGRFTNCNKAVQVNGNTGNILISGISAPGSNIALDQVGDSAISVLGGNFDATTSLVSDTSKLEGYFFNELPEENQFRVISELSVGLPNRGRETTLGEGDSYVTGMQVYTYNGSTFTNVSEEASSALSSTFSLPGTAVNNAIYISSAFDIINPLKFYGIRINQTVAANLGSGDLVFEYWDGSAWAEFNHMVTDANAPHRPYANDKLTQTGEYQVYFDTRLETLWQTNDPVSLGVNLHWMRIRVNSAITTAPTFEQIKIHTNRLEIEANGFQTMFGLARIKEKFPITFTGLDPVPGRGPQSKDVYLSDEIAVGFVNNNFENRQQTQSAAFTQLIPFEVDTSSPLTLTITYLGTSNTAGDINFRFRWATSKEGDGMFIDAGGAPTTFTNERSVSSLVAFPSNESFQQKKFELELEIPEAISQTTDGGPQSKLWVVVERIGGDQYNGDIVVTDIAVFYTAWREGGYVGEFT